jgi:flavin reductase (DIM6/NTAB) family NADH-FMN oxidoreductase RutF
VIVANGVAGRCGATVSAFYSVSADSPTTLVSLNAASQITQSVEPNGAFNVNLLRSDQIQIAYWFTGMDDAAGANRFEGINSIKGEFERSPHG